MGHTVLILVYMSLWSSGLLVENNGRSAVTNDFRLVGGASRCAGKLEMKRQNENWKSVEGDNWNLKLANRVCPELNCGSAVSIRITEASSIEECWDIKYECDEPSLNKCFIHSTTLNSFLELKCSDSVRLVHGSSVCSGRLEVQSNQSWSSVCEEHFDLQDANMVCRELGCGAPSVLQGVHYKEAETHLWHKFQCEGHESVVLDCGGSVSDTCSSGKAVELTCSEPVRLVGGVSRCDGAVQLRHHGQWRYVLDYVWTMTTAAVVCNLLDCGSPVSLRRKVDSFHTMWSITPSCIHATSTLRDCVTTQDAHSSYQLEITCSDSVRLVHGSSVCSGRLEVQSNLTWSSVCEEHFGLRDAEVVCRELGCGAPSVLQGALYGEPETSQWKMFQCEGHEAALLDCGGSVSDTCSPGKAVELTCSDSNVRLVGGASPCDGSVQLKQHGEWRDVTVYDWTLKAVSVICGQLNCGFAISMKEKHDSERPVWEIRPLCVQSISTLRDCITGSDITTHSSLDITCSESVRLVHGSSLCSGRLEIQSDQSWSSVCEEHIHIQDAEVVCRELGCGSPSVLHGALFEEGEVPVWTSELQCEGYESSVLDCKESGSFGKICLSGKAAGLTCSEPVRLVGQPSRCAGTLEIHHQGQWRPVGTSFQSDQQFAAAVCRHLDCGSAVSDNSTNEVSDTPVWIISSACVKLTSALQDCLKLNSYGYVSTLEVLCSDLLAQPNISLSSSNDLVSEAQQQMFQVPMGSSFTITCSVQPQYQGGFFQLISDTSEPQNHTLPAVNHSAHFLFSAADHTHQGGYTCVYHIHVFNQNFSSESEALHLTVSAPVTKLIVCLVVIILILLTFTISLHFYCKGAAQTKGFSLKRGFLNPDLRFSSHHIQHD